jgi:hypothetical protein
MKQDVAALNTSFGTPNKIVDCLVYCLAGQAAAICLGNKQKQLPAVHFNIQIKQQGQHIPSSSQLIKPYGKDSAIIVGGRLVQSLPLVFSQATNGFSQLQKEQYRCAIEADVINLLSGPLAEAKYTALCDNEDFDAKLFNLNSLQFYGVSSDLEVINEYMEGYLSDEEERVQKIKDLMLTAFNFINKRSHWRIISNLADFIRSANRSTITCEEVSAFLGSQCISAPLGEVRDFSGKHKFRHLSEQTSMV